MHFFRKCIGSFGFFQPTIFRFKRRFIYLLCAVYQRPLLCERARDPLLESRPAPPPSSCGSSGYDELSEIQSEVSYQSTSHPEHRPKSSTTALNGKFQRHNDATTAASETSRHTARTNSIHSTTEFDSEVDVPRDNHRENEPNYAHRSSRTGSYCKVHGFVKATAVAASVRHFRGENSVRPTKNESIFEESEEENGEDYSYVESERKMHRHVQVHHNHDPTGAKILVESAPLRSARSKRKSGRPMAAASSSSQMESLEWARQAKSERLGRKLWGLRRHLAMCGDRQFSRTSQWDSDFEGWKIIRFFNDFSPCFFLIVFIFFPCFVRASTASCVFLCLETKFLWKTHRPVLRLEKVTLHTV